MKLKELLNGVCECNLDVEVADVVTDTRKIKTGALFVCIAGEHFDSHGSAKEMIEKGAVAVICEHDVGVENQFIVENTRNALSLIASNFYGNPSRSLKLIGVTGTNGKTTSTYILKQVLEALGHRTGLIGTIAYDTGFRRIHATNTTPEPMQLQAVFSEMVDSGCEYVVMEASSQALAQGRLYGEHFVGAIFTNLTEDHLDYHKTKENYFLAKKMLLDNADVAIVNADDEAGKRLLEMKPCPKIFGYSLEGVSDYNAENIKLSVNGVSYWAKLGDKAYLIKFPMAGEYSVKNSLGVFALLHELGFDVKEIATALIDCEGVRGRNEIIPTGRDFTIICDFAHTPDALSKILTQTKQFTEGKLYCLFGAAGERDAIKRPLMGAVVANLADFIILTSDNPAHEDEQKIADDVLKGIKNHNTPYTVILDRVEAINYAVSQLKTGDVLVLAGKGHEDYQQIGETKVPFDEREIVRNALEKLR